MTMTTPPDGGPTPNHPPPETEDATDSSLVDMPRRPAEPPEPQIFEIAIARSLQARSSSLLSTFLALDGDGDGYVDRTDLRTALHNSLGIDLTDGQIDAIFARFAYFEDDGRDAEAPPDNGREESDDENDDDEDGRNPRHKHHGIRYQEFVRYVTETTSASAILPPSSAAGSTLFLSPSDDDSLTPIHLHKPRRAHDLRRSLARTIRSSGKSTKDLFLKIDVDRSGSITVDEFRAFVEGVGFVWTEEQLELALGQHYHPQRGVDYQEFAVVLEELDGGDLDGDGSLKVTTEQGAHDDPRDDEMRRRGVEAAEEADRRAKELLGGAVKRCADDSRTDAQIVRTIAERLYAKHTLLVDAFRKFDLDGNGRLSGTELCEALTEAGLDVSVDRAERLVRRFDADGDGRLSLSEFVRLMSSSFGDEEEEEGETQSGNAAAGTGAGANVDALSDSNTTNPPAEGGTMAAADSAAAAAVAIASSADASVVSAVLGHEDDESRRAGDNDGLDDNDVSAILMLRDALETERTMARRAFQNFDSDMSRDLSPDELRDGFERLGIEVSQEHISHIMHRFDPGETGTLKYYQFVKLLSADLGV